MSHDPYEPQTAERAGYRDDDGERWRQRAGRFWSWLKRRPLESWGFFIVGLLLGNWFL